MNIIAKDAVLRKELKDIKSLQASQNDLIHELHLKLMAYSAAQNRPNLNLVVTTNSKV